IVALSVTTRGLWVSEWGHTGVTTKEVTDGISTGPPAAREYAVEPVGVAMMTPSALQLNTKTPSMTRSKSKSRAIALLLTTASFNAKYRATLLPSRIRL